MIQAIIFDCFGVLTTEGWQAFKQKHFSNDPEKLAEATKVNQLADTGKLRHEELLPLIADIAGMTTQQARDEIDDYHVNEQLFTYITTELVDHFKIGMLSNVSDDWLTKMFSPEQLKLFDQIALSYVTGYVKPDKRAYQHIADMLGVAPRECLFIDDLEYNIAGAEQAGMRALQYNNFNQCVQDIELLLEMSNSNK